MSNLKPPKRTWQGKGETWLSKSWRHQVHILSINLYTYKILQPHFQRKLGCCVKYKLKQCDDFQNTETPYLITNSTKTTYQMMKRNVIVFFKWCHHWGFDGSNTFLKSWDSGKQGKIVQLFTNNVSLHKMLNNLSTVVIMSPHFKTDTIQ